MYQNREIYIDSTPARPDTYRAPRLTSIHAPLRTKQPAKHVCSFVGRGRCVCGKHRDGATATSFRVMGTDAERLSVEL